MRTRCKRLAGVLSVVAGTSLYAIAIAKLIVVTPSNDEYLFAGVAGSLGGLLAACFAAAYNAVLPSSKKELSVTESRSLKFVLTGIVLSIFGGTFSVAFVSLELGIFLAVIGMIVAAIGFIIGRASVEIDC